MSETTPHGENIANEILGEDAYGSSDDLTVADVWNILDNLQTSFMEQYERKISSRPPMIWYIVLVFGCDN